MMITLGGMLSSIILPDESLSFSERRRLEEFPKITMASIVKGEFFNQLEAYSLDHFVFRDDFRSIKAYGVFHLFRQKDNHGFYLVDNTIIKMEYPLNEDSIHHAAKKLNEIGKRYLQGKKVYYGIIPDKNYFLADKYERLSMDYERMIEIMRQRVENMNYINLFETLTLDDYYKTDIHWRQEAILDTADRLLEAMGNSYQVSDIPYERNELYPFLGSYYGQVGLKVKPDTLIYLTAPYMKDALVFDYETMTKSKIYETEKFAGMDSYDVYLSGAKALITVTNPESNTDKELILFRDSFGSSIAPLLLGAYSKITLVDLRYISTDLLGEYIDFSKDQDVLFLYNTHILNQSYMLK